MVKQGKWAIRILGVAFMLLNFVPNPVLAFDWPQGISLAQKIQIINQELFNMQRLIAGMMSQDKITAKAYLAVDLSGGEIFLQENKNKAFPIASTTKLMNAVIARENIDLEEKIILTDQMLLPEGKSPAIFSGSEITAGNLLRASLIQSVNDASEALAYFEGKDEFLGMMNQKAKELGMVNTIYYDVHGLNPRNQSSPADMAKLLEYIYKNHREILDTTKDDNFWLPNAQGRIQRFLNLNDFYSFPEFIGGKSGYLVQAGQTFASIFELKGKPVAIVLLNSNNYRSDTFKIINQINERN